jgi:hypothetical protein
LCIVVSEGLILKLNFTYESSEILILVLIITLKIETIITLLIYSLKLFSYVSLVNTFSMKQDFQKKKLLKSNSPDELASLFTWNDWSIRLFLNSVPIFKTEKITLISQTNHN